MSAQTFVSPSGKLDLAPLHGLPSDPEESVSLIATLGAHSLRQAQLLDQIFSTQFSGTESQGITAAPVYGDDSAVMTDTPHNMLILNVEPFDGPDVSREESRERACHLALALSDVVLFVVRMNDLSRVNTNGVAALRASITQMLILQSDGVVSTPTDKRAFLVFVRDFEADVMSREEIISGFLQEMQTVYNLVAKPPRSPVRITELFEFEFFLLPNEKLLSAEYDASIAKVRQQLLDPAADDYFFEGSRFSRSADLQLAEATEDSWRKMEVEQTADMPPGNDLLSAFNCDIAMRKVFEKYQRGIRVWRRETEGGVIIEKFGAAASDMVQKTMSVYEQDASPHKSSKAFRRKRDELKDMLNADLYGLFVTQIAKLREVTYRMFKDKLDGISNSEARLDRAVNSALKESEKSFRTNAEALRPGFASWRYDNDVKELAAQMREDATERLQRARIADYQENGGQRNRRRRPAIGAAAGSKPRQPINVSFHYLDPAPFGWKDSRYEKLSVDDNLEFQGDKPAALGAGSGSGASGGLSVPLTPSRDSGWYKKNKDFIYTERK